MSEKDRIELVVFDWAGTTVDYACSTPTEVFDRIFRNADVRFTKEEINEPMGIDKRTHIRTLLQSEKGSTLWHNAHGSDWTEDDVDRLFAQFETVLLDVVAEKSDPLPGVVETVNELRDAGIKIGSTTGYTAEMIGRVLPGAAAGGYQPDCVVTPDDTGIGRPTPFMLFECMRQLNVYPPTHVVKVGDTLADIAEGKNAGAFAFGVLEGSNLLGLSAEEAASMEMAELYARRSEARTKYLNAGADDVINTIRDLPKAIKRLNKKLQR